MGSTHESHNLAISDVRAFATSHGARIFDRAELTELKFPSVFTSPLDVLCVLPDGTSLAFVVRGAKVKAGDMWHYTTHTYFARPRVERLVRVTAGTSRVKTYILFAMRGVATNVPGSVAVGGECRLFRAIAAADALQHDEPRSKDGWRKRQIPSWAMASLSVDLGSLLSATHRPDAMALPALASSC